MSWSIKVTGKPALVIAEVNAVQGMPQGLKDTVAAIASEVKDTDYANGVFVESFGHIGGGSSNGKFNCELIHLAAEIAPPAAEATPVNTEKPAEVVQDTAAPAPPENAT